MDVIEFAQKDIIDYIALPENKALFTKISKDYGVDFSTAEGFCYGISNAFIKYMHSNKGDEYIENLNELMKVINNKEGDLSKIVEVKQQAEQNHARSLLNSYIVEMIHSQSISEKIFEVKVHYSNLQYPEKLTEKNIKEEIKNIIDFNKANSEINPAVNGSNRSGKISPYIAEKSLISLDKYVNALFADADFFNTE